MAQSPGKIFKIIAVGRQPKKTAVRAIALAVFCFILFKYLLIPVRMCGKSMEPAYRSGSLNFVNTLSFRFCEPGRGDVVAIAMAGRRVMLLKRILAFPGETVAFSKGNLIVDGVKITESYLKVPCKWEMQEVKNGPDEYFAAGDNRSVQFSFHIAGRVKRRKIVGKVLF